MCILFFVSTKVNILVLNYLESLPITTFQQHEFLFYPLNHKLNDIAQFTVLYTDFSALFIVLGILMLVGMLSCVMIVSL